MRHRLEVSLTDRATIRRYRELDPDDDTIETNAIGEPINDTESGDDSSLEPIAEDVPCQFDDRSTSFVREDSGERVQRPATVTFAAAIADELQEGDLVDIEGESTTYEIRGLDTQTDHRRGYVVSVEAELERAD
jgi:hypothetical protein